MNVKKTAVIMNGFVHDFASGIWLAALMVIYMLHAAHIREPAVVQLINPLERSFFWWSVGAMVAIMATGAGRTFTYVDNWYGEDAEKVRRRMLIIKHVILLTAFSVGYLFIWGKVFH
ncbi:MAG: hypothetical protein WCL71_01715 [Deltaproteobacteria bacterium]